MEELLRLMSAKTNITGQSPWWMVVSCFTGHQELVELERGALTLKCAASSFMFK